jgi:hypothetical protein
MIINSKKYLNYKLINRERTFAYDKVFKVDTEEDREEFYGVIDACNETMNLIEQGHSIKEVIKISKEKKSKLDNDHYLKGVNLVLKILEE